MKFQSVLYLRKLRGSNLGFSEYAVVSALAEGIGYQYKPHVCISAIAFTNWSRSRLGALPSRRDSTSAPRSNIKKGRCISFTFSAKACWIQRNRLQPQNRISVSKATRVATVIWLSWFAELSIGRVHKRYCMRWLYALVLVRMKSAIEQSLSSRLLWAILVIYSTLHHLPDSSCVLQLQTNLRAKV